MGDEWDGSGILFFNSFGRLMVAELVSIVNEDCLCNTGALLKRIRLYSSASTLVSVAT